MHRIGQPLRVLVRRFAGLLRLYVTAKSSARPARRPVGRPSAGPGQSGRRARRRRARAELVAGRTECSQWPASGFLATTFCFRLADRRAAPGL